MKLKQLPNGNFIDLDDLARGEIPNKLNPSLNPMNTSPGGNPLGEPAPTAPIGSPGGTPRPEPVPPRTQTANKEKLLPTPAAPMPAAPTTAAIEIPEFNALPSEAITKKFQGASAALDAAKRANELANDPELTKAKANNNLMSSIFAGNAAQIGSTFGKDMSGQTAALKGSFDAANQSMDAQLTQADRIAKGAELDAKQAGLAADEESAQLARVKDQIGIKSDQQQMQMRALDMAAKSSDLANLDSPVMPVQLQFLRSKGFNIPDGTTNRQLKNMNDLLQSELTFKNSASLEAQRARNQEKLTTLQNAGKPRPEDPALTKFREKRALDAAGSMDTANKSLEYGRALIKRIDDEFGGRLTENTNFRDIPVIGGVLGDTLIKTDTQQLAGAAAEFAAANKNAFVGKDGNMNQKEYEGAIATIMAPGAEIGDIRRAIDDINRRLESQARSNAATIQANIPGATLPAASAATPGAGAGAGVQEFGSYSDFKKRGK